MAVFWRQDLRRQQKRNSDDTSPKWKYRCEICTLTCPCSHVSRYRLAQMNKEKIKQYSTNEGAPICEEFFLTKHCTSSEVRGWCHFAHPPVRNTVMPPKRCDVCTKKIIKKYCYLHRPPIGEGVGDSDRRIMIIGSEVSKRFKQGEIVGYNSSLGK